MRLAYVTSDEKGLTDRVLGEAAGLIVQSGLHPVGVVQTNVERPQRFHCDMDLHILPGGPVINITQDLGANARGCRLDAGALENAVAAVSTRLAAGADLLILNKFGKHEAEGRGFRPVIAEALERGLPVILGVNALNLAAFHDFAGDLGEVLPADPTPIVDWCLRLWAEAA
ncbi:MAG: DUF2478 domain-containing protein [Albidovulum sp.]|uniref:DUF2478 domain-containing protein n=1 Tax=Albidovulum sp. TaxID=1872424 RepID=UPI003CC04015